MSGEGRVRTEYRESLDRGLDAIVSGKIARLEDQI